MSEDFGHDLAPGTLDADVSERWRDDKWDYVEQAGAVPDDEWEDDQRETGEWHPEGIDEEEGSE